MKMNLKREEDHCIIDASFAVAKRKPEKKIRVCMGFESLTFATPVQSRFKFNSSSRSSHI